MEKIRVVIADDHPLIREGLRRVLELDENIEIAGEVGDGQGAINLARSLRPDIILMDLKMPGTSGKEASRVIRREMPDIKIIILTVAEDEEMLEVIKAGASGYLLKDVEPAELMKSIYDVLEGRPAFVFSVIYKLTSQRHFRSIINVLTLFYAEKKPSHAVKSVAGI